MLARSEVTMFDPPQILDTDVELGDNAITVLRKRYLLRGPNDEPTKTPTEMF